MSVLVKKKMTADEFLAWGEGQDGRWELQDGALVAMAPERVAHTETKGEIFSALRNAIAAAKASCRTLTEGASVRIDAETVFEPDVLVYCGARVSPEALEIPDPIITVEVLSPSTAARDHGVKLTGYFSLPGLSHYLIVDPDRRVVIHHKRGQGDVIETRILSEGVLRLDPPGLEVPVAELFPPL
jgi:Uma2 family endonuclease